MQISALAIYPVKSLGPVALQEAEVTPRGLAGDRRWMIVDAQGRFVTRRELPVLARIGMSLDQGGFRLHAQDGNAFLPATLTDGVLATVTVWRDTAPAYVVENDASRLISQIAGRTLRLAYLPEETNRPVDPTYARAGDTVSFADAFPVLIATEASLAALNATLETPVEMARFRPNIVLSGSEKAWAERGWSALEAGNLRLRLPKACIRCIVITQQPDTGERQEGNAVPTALRRLGQFGPQGALFGMNAVPELTPGRLSVGDRVVSA
ncbi:MOSC N-terminal beta barrel domain-containing protein [Sphingobium sp. DEHP117]|uniref:MOSC domain-containing protein n=1 Tax=Sphingobium sp. DEHP117 TaxID=2993436 RepID=UPI0027D4D30C|nr:MOSC N-terminal beta barrel domain-containing protein [Sphingobium sp. DEHP117]MDQ4421155.1 MOSC N-terminal beta barrel domain-containing protein [Sphingobium sp. DEHP117]